MAEYMKLVDLTKCTGCRACQVACKQWNELPAEATAFTGSIQNPKDLTFSTWNLVRFDEVEKNEELNWLMRHDACMHCETPACVKVCPTGSMIRTKEGAVIHDDKTCIGCRACVVACPFDIPRYSPVLEKISKCNLCYDRITDGRKPACVTACNTGCLDFGTKEQMTAKAARIAAKTGGTIYPDNPEYRTHMLFILPPGIDIEDYSHANPNPKMPVSILWWKNLFKPFTLLGMGGVAGAALLHYMIKGPHVVDEGGDSNE